MIRLITVVGFTVAGAACSGGAGVAPAAGDCQARPFGGYLFTAATQPVCMAGWSPASARYEVTFGVALADGGTGVQMSGASRPCEERWQACDVVVTCSSSPMTFEYDAAKNELRTRGSYCSCENGSTSPTTEQCELIGRRQ